MGVKSKTMIWSYQIKSFLLICTNAKQQNTRQNSNQSGIRARRKRNDSYLGVFEVCFLLKCTFQITNFSQQAGQKSSQNNIQSYKEKLEYEEKFISIIETAFVKKITPAVLQTSQPAVTAMHQSNNYNFYNEIILV